MRHLWKLHSNYAWTGTGANECFGSGPEAPIITPSPCTSSSVRKNDGRKWSKGLLEVCARNEVMETTVNCQLTSKHRPGQEAAVYLTDWTKVSFSFHPSDVP